MGCEERPPHDSQGNSPCGRRARYQADRTVCAREQPTPDDWNPFDELVGAKSIYSSVHDLYAYDQALYTAQLVLQETLAEAFEPAMLPGGQTVPYGFGWRLGTYSGHEYAGHGGDWEGYRCYIVRFADDRFSVYLLANRYDIDPESLAFQIFDVFEPTL